MNEKNRLYKALKHPEWLFGVVLRRAFSKWMDDRCFIKWEYFSGMGKFPNIDHPRTFNEKLQWLKLNDIHPEYSLLVDKYEAKEIVRKRIGDEYIIPTLGVWNSFNEIDFDKLPDKFVLKTTHDSGGVAVCMDKSDKTISSARKKINKSLKHNFFYEHREYPYKSIKPRIIAEQYMVDESGTELKDYKFFCFDGKCKMLFIATDRSIGDVKFDFFDTDFNHLPFKQGHPWANKKIIKPVIFILTVFRFIGQFVKLILFFFQFFFVFTDILYIRLQALFPAKFFFEVNNLLISSLQLFKIHGRIL